jgi:hypothetical protein
MTQREFESWINFYNMQPFDDLHRYHRPAALVARSFSGADIGDLLEWLQPQVEDKQYSEADLKTFKAFGMKRPPRSK